MRDALETLGAGAKTAVGYGVFGEPAAFVPGTQEASPNGLVRVVKTPVDLPSGELRSLLMEKKTKKGGWMARHIETGVEGPIQGTAPSDYKPGDEVTLLRANRTDFKWPTAEDRQRLAPPPRKPSGKPAGKGKGGRGR